MALIAVWLEFGEQRGRGLFQNTGLFEMIVGVLTACHTLEIELYVFFYLIENTEYL